MHNSVISPNFLHTIALMGHRDDISRETQKSSHFIGLEQRGIELLLCTFFFNYLFTHSFIYLFIQCTFL